jgi:hypothetical protein
MQPLFEAIITSVNSLWPRIVREDAHFQNETSVAYRFHDSSEFNFILTLIRSSAIEIHCSRLLNGERVNVSLSIIGDRSSPLLIKADGTSYSLNGNLNGQASYVVGQINYFFSPPEEPARSRRYMTICTTII